MPILLLLLLAVFLVPGLIIGAVVKALALFAGVLVLLLVYRWVRKRIDEA